VNRDILTPTCVSLREKRRRTRIAISLDFRCSGFDAIFLLIRMIARGAVKRDVSRSEGYFLLSLCFSRHFGLGSSIDQSIKGESVPRLVLLEAAMLVQAPI
jgi:hypothetical protein